MTRTRKVLDVVVTFVTACTCERATTTTEEDQLHKSVGQWWRIGRDPIFLLCEISLKLECLQNFRFLLLMDFFSIFFIFPSFSCFRKYMYTKRHYKHSYIQSQVRFLLGFWIAQSEFMLRNFMGGSLPYWWNQLNFVLVVFSAVNVSGIQKRN